MAITIERNHVPFQTISVERAREVAREKRIPLTKAMDDIAGEAMRESGTIDFIVTQVSKPSETKPPKTTGRRLGC